MLRKGSIKEIFDLSERINQQALLTQKVGLTREKFRFLALMRGDVQ